MCWGCIFAQVPEGALAIYQHTDRFRQQIGSLDLMVSLYNKLQRTTLAVEWPLVAGKLEAVGKYAGRTLNPAVPMPSRFTGHDPSGNCGAPQFFVQTMCQGSRRACYLKLVSCFDCRGGAAQGPRRAGLER